MPRQRRAVNPHSRPRCSCLTSLDLTALNTSRLREDLLNVTNFVQGKPLHWLKSRGMLSYIQALALNRLKLTRRMLVIKPGNNRLIWYIGLGWDVTNTASLGPEQGTSASAVAGCGCRSCVEITTDQSSAWRELMPGGSPRPCATRTLSHTKWIVFFR